MTSIFSAFKEYKRAHRVERDGDVNHTPLFAETPSERKAAMARLRERWPSVFARETAVDANPHEQFEAAVADYRAHPPAPLSDRALAAMTRGYGAAPTHDANAAEGS